MIQIIVLNPGISVGGYNFPDNTLTFKKIGDEVEIKNAHGKEIFCAPYAQFMDSNSAPYASADAVITELKNSYS